MSEHPHWRKIAHAEKARADKAERALAENEQTWEDMRAYNIRLEERAREAERALAEIADYIEAEFREGDKAYQAVIIARAALRPSGSNDV